jgi:hypothetical protein
MRIDMLSKVLCFIGMSLASKNEQNIIMADKSVSRKYNFSQIRRVDDLSKFCFENKIKTSPIKIIRFKAYNQQNFPA